MNSLTLALLAHDLKTEDMLNLIRAHQDELSKFDLVAGNTVGELVKSKTDLNMTVLSGKSDKNSQQIGVLVADGDVDAVIFLLAPLSSETYEPEMAALLHICDIQGVPMATNLAAGEAIIHLMFEHPEALSGHHLAAQYLEDIAAIHD